MIYSCEFQHHAFGLLTLRGQYQPFEDDTNTPESVTLESVIDEDGEELLVYGNAGVPLMFTRDEVAEMQAALLHTGEPVGRVKPTQALLANVRRMLGIAPVVVVDQDTVILDAV